LFSQHFKVVDISHHENMHSFENAIPGVGIKYLFLLEQVMALFQ
jgi:hypothetical protein